MTHHLGLLQGQFILIGILVALLGAGIVVSGLRRRHGGWMTVLGWPALSVPVPGTHPRSGTPLAAQIAAVSPQAVSACRRCVSAGLRHGYPTGLVMEEEITVPLGLPGPAPDEYVPPGPG